MADTNQGEQPDEQKPDAPDYEKAVRDGQHFDPSATGTNFRPDVVVGPGNVIKSDNIPGGDYYALKAIRDQGRAKIAAESAAAAPGTPDATVLSQGGISIVFETGKDGVPVADSVRVFGAPTEAATESAGGAQTGAGAAAQATSGGQVSTATPAAGAAASDASAASSRTPAR